MPRPVVVFASGQLLTAECWAPQVAALSRDYDLRFSDHTRDETIAGMAGRLLEEAPERFHLVAHAMGGFTAFEVARQAQARIRSLTLIATLAPDDGPAQTERRRGYIRLVEDGRFSDVVEERIPILLHPARREDASLLARVRRMAAETGPATFLCQQRAIMGRADSRPGLRDIRVPTLVVRGAQDGITTAAHQAEIVEGVAGARSAVLDDCGHLPTLERPTSATRLLAEWLAEVSF